MPFGTGLGSGAINKDESESEDATELVAEPACGIGGIEYGACGGEGTRSRK